jgi:hypothetical protein
MTALSHLSFSVNRLSGTIPTVLGQMTALTAMYDMNVDIASVFSPLTSSRTSGIGSNRLTGTLPTELAKLTALMAKTWRLAADSG